MAQAMINPDVLSWARQRAGVDVSALAEKLHVDPDRLVAWETGQARPTFKQAQKLARHVFLPFGYLFLKSPPEERLPIPDLRTIGDHQPGNISVNLRDTVRDVIARQQWYQEYQQEHAIVPTAVVGKMSAEAGVMAVVADMKAKLGIRAWPQRGTWEDYARDLINGVESLGILVMRSSMVGNNTHRLLDVAEFRGFALADRRTPVIFINTADCPEARLFTLIHELAHIWIGESGISDVKPGNQRKIEQFCNAVAAEFLVPEDEFLSLWIDDDDWKKNLLTLANHFHVSRWVIARRGLSLGLVGDTEYWAFVNKVQADYKNRARDGAPTFNRMQTVKVSRLLAQAVASEALSGRMLLRDAWHLIGIRPERLASYAKKELGI